MKRKQYKEVTKQYLDELRLKDTIGTLTADELKVLRGAGIKAFTDHSINSSMFLKNVDKKTRDYHESCAKKHRI